MKISTAARNAAVDAVVDLLDNITNAIIEIRTGAPPANVSDPDSGTLLATLEFDNPAFGAAASGTATANAIVSDTNIDNTGTADHFRIKDENSGGNTVMQGTVGTSGADINFDSDAFVAGGTAAITSLTVTQPIGS